jgi:hypothetical protein
VTQQVSAKPQAFMLKLRLAAPDGTPFFRRHVRVKWEDQMHPPPQKPPFETDAHGAISVLLPAPGRTAPHGELHVLDRVEQTEVVRWCIPLQIASDPPPAALPGIEEAPEPPAEGGGAPDLEKHEQAMVDYRARVLVQIRERIVELEQAWRALADVVTALPQPPQRGASDGELWKAFEVFAYFAALVSNGYEAAWRLYNLADLPLDEEPTLPFLASTFEALLRALDRFGYRHALPTPLPRPVNVAEIPVYLQKIQEVHDQRGRLVPVP